MVRPQYESQIEISIVVPMFNESEVLHVFFKRVLHVLDGLETTYEIICVNDGSKDDTLKKLLALQENFPAIKIIDLSRNFGKELALTAGLDHASGHAVIPIDADLQDPPEIIPQMLEKWREGYDVVLAVREDRSADSFSKRNSARIFYSILRKMGEVHIPANAGDFRLMDRRVINSLQLVRERSRFMKGIFAWVGYKTTVVMYTRKKRAAGESSWRFWKLWNFALEGIFSFSSMPLKLWSYIGLFTSACAIIYMLVIIGRTLILGVEVPGYASLMSVILFFHGLTLTCTGIMGEYIGRIFNEVKQRPLYLIRETSGFDQDLKKAASKLAQPNRPC